MISFVCLFFFSCFLTLSQIDRNISINLSLQSGSLRQRWTTWIWSSCKSSHRFNQKVKEGLLENQGAFWKPLTEVLWLPTRPAELSCHSDFRALPTIFRVNAKKRLRSYSTCIAIFHIRLKLTRQLPAQRAQKEKKHAKCLAETINGSICCVVVPFWLVACIDVTGNNIRSMLTSLHGAWGYSCLHTRANDGAD